MDRLNINDSLKFFTTLLVALTTSLTALAGASDDNETSEAELASSASLRGDLRDLPGSVTTKRLSLVLPSVVVHGFAISRDVANQMPRKLDGGQTVVTPGVGLQYVSRDGFLVLGGVLKDCYDNLAGLIQVGQQFKLFGPTTFGYSVGVYARETPVACRTTTNRFGRTTTTCDEFDNYQFKYIAEINGVSVDIIPMPFLHLTAPLIRSRDFELDFKVMSNFALNEFGFSVPF